MKKISLVPLVFVFATFLMISGCTEDTVVNPPSGTTTELGTLTSTPTGIIQNTSTLVKFQLNVKPGVTLVDANIKINKKDASGNLTEIGLLQDNGDTTNGDEISNDGIYNGRVSVNEPSAGNISYVGSALVSYQGQNVTANSNTTSIVIYSSVSVSTINENKQTLKSAETFFLNSLGGNLSNYENAMTQTAAYLQTQPGVTSATYSPESPGIRVTYSSGIKGGFLVSQKDAQGHSTQGGLVSDSLRNMRDRRSQIPLQMQTRGENSSVRFPEGQELSDNPLLEPNIVGNRNVLIYTPYRSIFTPDKVPIVKNALDQANCRDFKYTEYANQAATVAVLADMTKFGFVFMDTHGLRGELIFTGEKLDIFKPNFTQYYLPLLLSGQLGLWEKLVISNTGTSQDTATVYTVYPEFIKQLPGTFPNTVIFNSSCESTIADNLKDAFFTKGAKAYYGYSRIVYSNFAAAMADTVARRFARGLASNEAYYDATDPHNPYSAHFELKSSTNMSFSFSLINGNYEAGTLEGWTKEGDGRILTRLGSIAPPQGSYLGIISTGLGYTTSSGSLSQCLKVENNQSSLTLKWNFLSEEFLEYIHSEFQDYFRIKLIKSDGAEVTLFSKNIDQLATQFGADTNQIGQLVKVSPDIVFDRGDVYMTNWQTTTLDVTPYRGQTIVIVLICGDIGDSIYDTAILLDEVKIQ